MKILKHDLINHYEQWAETTRNPLHKHYALGQIERIKNDLPLWSENPRGSMYYHQRTNKFFTGATEAAKFFGATRWFIQRYPEKFGLIKQK